MADTPDAPENPGQTTHAEAEADTDAKQWAMFVHLSQYCMYLAPVLGVILPIVLWQMKKDIWPTIDVHGKIVLNWLISVIIYSFICLILTFVAIGIFGFIVLGLMALIFPLIGGIKANNGEVWEYPLTIKIIK